MNNNNLNKTLRYKLIVLEAYYKYMNDYLKNL